VDREKNEKHHLILTFCTLGNSTNPPHPPNALSHNLRLVNLLRYAIDSHSSYFVAVVVSGGLYLKKRAGGSCGGLLPKCLAQDGCIVEADST